MVTMRYSGSEGEGVAAKHPDIQIDGLSRVVIAPRTTATKRNLSARIAGAGKLNANRNQLAPKQGRPGTTKRKGVE